MASRTSAIETDDYPRVASRMSELHLPTLIVMEGGSAVDALGKNLSAVLEGF